MDEKKKGLTYSDAGVDIDKGNQLVDRIMDSVKETHTPGVIGGLGGFGGFFAPDFSKYENPVLVAGTDGVGTKLKLAHRLNRHSTIGIDLVAMCVNDILAQGAAPLFFLDYLACGELDLEQTEEIIKGIAEGCKQANTALIGGETAEMPGFYPPGAYDVAGFAVGIVDRERVITGSNIEEGDLILGLPSSGLHSNGFSLVRYLLKERDHLNLEQEVAALNCTLGEELLKPTRIYVQPVLPLIENFNIRGIAHITGGGLRDNLARILPSGLQAELEWGSWPLPPVFNFIQEQGRIENEEMLRTFNQGIGFALVIAPEEKEDIISILEGKDEKVYEIGRIDKGEPPVVIKGIDKEGGHN